MESHGLREERIWEELESEIDRLFGEDFLMQIMAGVERVVRIEAHEFLGMTPPDPIDLGEQIAYHRAIRRLERLRKEEAARSLLDLTYLVARSKHDNPLTDKEFYDSASEIKERINHRDDYGVRVSLGERYG